ncbi:hypothetical protein BB561_000694 [Smittium simulii]|uniref:Uncharacterized protein n=1 Tax=Smittium simulii TaxID=133385 RepID=A0A2T9YXZ5_9FUNG|nr:hypothetical protein BB561_000694 [Smittium simulii]
MSLSLEEVRSVCYSSQREYQLYGRVFMTRFIIVLKENTNCMEGQSKKHKRAKMGKNGKNGKNGVWPIGGSLIQIPIPNENFTRDANYFFSQLYYANYSNYSKITKIYENIALVVMLKDIIKGLHRGAKHGVLTAKQGRNFYKGNRTGSTGHHTIHGRYIIEWDKVRTYVVPDLTDCKLKPYVSHNAKYLQEPIPKPEDFL